jgi:hypothetical protein
VLGVDSGLNGPKSDGFRKEALLRIVKIGGEAVGGGISSRDLISFYNSLRALTRPAL